MSQVRVEMITHTYHTRLQNVLFFSAVVSTLQQWWEGKGWGEVGKGAVGGEEPA